MGKWSKISALSILPVMTGIMLAFLVLAMGYKGAAIAAGIGVFILVMLRPDVGILLTIFCLLNLGAQGVLSGLDTRFAATIPKMIGMLTVVSWAYNVLFFKRRIIITKSMLAALLFVALAMLSTYYAIDRKTASTEAVRIVTIVALYFLIINLIRTRRQFFQLLWLLIFSAFFISSLAIYQNINPASYMEADVVEDLGNRHEGAYIERDELSSGVSIRSTGTMTHPNWLALFLVMMLPISITLFFLKKRHTVKLLLLSAIMLELLALVYTHTRMGVLALGIFFILMVQKRLIRLTPLAWIVLFLGVLIGGYCLPANFKERVLNFHHLRHSPAISYRIEAQKVGLQMFKDHPLKGVGIGNYGPNMISYYKNRYYTFDYENPQIIGAHNMYIELLAEGGLVGFLSLIGFIFFVLKDLRKGLIRHKERGDTVMAQIALAIRVSFLVFLFSALFLHAQEWKFWWIIAALATSLSTINLDDTPGNKKLIKS